MTESELMGILVDHYDDLQRILPLVSGDAKKEVQRQLKVLAVKLEAMGVVTTNLDFDDNDE